MRIRAVAALLIVAACGTPAADTTTVTPPPPPSSPPLSGSVANVLVTGSPDGLTLTSIGHPLQLAAAAYDSAGNALSGRSVSWSVAGHATIDQSGLVAASDAGLVTVTASVEGKSASVSFEAGFTTSLTTNGGVATYPSHATLAIGPSSLRDDGPVGFVPDAAVGPAPAGVTLLPSTGIDCYPRNRFFNLEFAEPTLTLSFDPATLPAGIDPSRLVIVQYSAGAVTVLPTIAANGTSVTALVPGFFTYAAGYR